MSDLTGRRFGWLTVLARASGDEWLCKCVCGHLVEVPGADLLSGKVRDCGCTNPNAAQRLKRRMAA